METEQISPRLRAVLKRRLRLARLALAWESLWPLLWPVAGVSGLFLALALFDVLPLLPGWLHFAVIVGFALAALLFLGRAVRSFRAPDDLRARRRIERDSGLPHQPLGALDDRLADGGHADPVARALWSLHRRRMAGAIGRLRVAPPSPGLPARDPWGLRAAVLLLLVVALAGTWRDAPSRLSRALSPAWGDGVDSAATLQVWLTPPSYTGLPPTLLEAPSDRPVAAPTVPAGSAILAVLQGGDGPGELTAGDRMLPFTPLGDSSQRLDAPLGTATSLAVRQDGGVVGHWNLTVVQDTAPTVVFLDQPDGDERGRLRLAYEAGDDYGVVKAWATIRRVGVPAGQEAFSLDLPLPATRSATLRHVSWHDLTAHRWAGLPVTITPAARDAAGQIGTGGAIHLVLPERLFHHPVARAIIEQRRLLGADPQRRHDVVGGIDDISTRPGTFGNDIVAFLALRTARSRLLRDHSADAIDSVRDIMWNTALRIEEGNRAVAERTLAEAARELEKALSEGAAQDELDRLMDQLQQAMEEFLQAAAEQAMRQRNPAAAPDPAARTVTPRELSSMLDRMREMARTGSRDAAQQMLSRLQDMLRNLEAGRPGQPSAAARQAQQALGELGELARQQRSLLDQTFQQSQQSETAPDQSAQGAARQEALRRALGEVMRRMGGTMGEIPDALGEAEQAMREAVGQLRGNAPGAAAEAQGEALERLRQGAGEALRALAERMGTGPGSPTAMPGGQGVPRDPLGRQLNGPGTPDDSSVHVPDEADVQKAREVLDELRRRLGESDRSTSERDYLQRLLRQF